MPDLRRFLLELKRRKVYHVAVAYVVVGLGVLGAAEVVLDPLGLGGARPYLVVLVLFGFPVALVLAWAYELRPEGAGGRDSGPPSAGARTGEGNAAQVHQAEVRPRDRSIAVLPFENMSSQPESEYFADGISEELTHALARLGDLRVAARTSAFVFKGGRTDVREIGRRLGVAHVVEGSVRRAGGRLRITAQLVDAARGHHLWSARFERELDDVFAIQDEIVVNVVKSLLERLPRPDRRPAVEGDRTALKTCSTCGNSFDDDVKFCPDDGTALKAKSQSQDPMMGKRLMDRWEVIDRIGAGGFGTVYKVRDLRFDYLEALKVFDRRKLNPDEVDEAVARFRREAMLLKRLGNLSQNIVGVSNMEDDEEGGFIYFTMELVQGENLSQILLREGALHPDRAVAIMKQVCKALTVAHNYEEGIVHRDLKLENVMITRNKKDEEVVKILDFGIAKAIGQQSLTNLTMGDPGTPGYAAPEQVEGREIDQRTDLFTLGVVFYGMLTGREPWLGGFITEPSSGGWILPKQSVGGDPIPAHRWDPEVPTQLEEIVFKLLEKAPDDRYQTAEDVHDALVAFEEGKLAPPVAKGTLRVLSQEPGVAIRVKQGVFKTVAEGRTPWEAEALEPGTYTVQVRDDRYEKETRDVEVTTEGAVEITLTAASLVDVRGSIVVETPEEGVRVRLRDGLRSLGEGTTPWEAAHLPPGDYKIEIVDSAYARESRPVRITANEEARVRLRPRAKADLPLGDKLKEAAKSPAFLGAAAVAVALSVVATRVLGDPGLPTGAIAAVLGVTGAVVLLGLSHMASRKLSTQQRAGPLATSRASRTFEAYDSYLRALHGYRSLDPERVGEAVRHVERAIDLDPTHAPAHALFPQILILQALGFGWRAPGALMARSGHAAERALELDPALPDAHMARGVVLMFQERRYVEARRELELAVELGPNLPEVHFWYEFYWTYVERDEEEALAASARARALSPLDPSHRIRHGTVLYLFGRYEEAEAEFRQMLSDGVPGPLPHLGMADTLIRIGRAAEAVEHMERAIELAPDYPVCLGVGAAVFGIAGLSDRTEEVVGSLHALAERGTVQHWWLAVGDAALGEIDRAFGHLDTAVEEREPGLLFLSVLPRGLGLHTDPRHGRILRRIGLGHLMAPV